MLQVVLSFSGQVKHLSKLVFPVTTYSLFSWQWKASLSYAMHSNCRKPKTIVTQRSSRRIWYTHTNHVTKIHLHSQSASQQQTSIASRAVRSRECSHPSRKTKQSFGQHVGVHLLLTTVTLLVGKTSKGSLSRPLGYPTHATTLRGEFIVEFTFIYQLLQLHQQEMPSPFSLLITDTNGYKTTQ